MDQDKTRKKERPTRQHQATTDTGGYRTDLAVALALKRATDIYTSIHYIQTSESATGASALKRCGRVLRQLFEPTTSLRIK